jgi:DNA-binding NtrC family response regulator
MKNVLPTKTILIVDDDESQRILLRETLAWAAEELFEELLEITSMPTGRQASDFINKVKPDMIISATHIWAGGATIALQKHEDPSVLLRLCTSLLGLSLRPLI